MKKDKIICNCCNVNVAKMIEAFENGITNWENLKEKTKIATICKKCSEHSQMVFEDILEKSKNTY